MNQLNFLNENIFHSKVSKKVISDLCKKNFFEFIKMKHLFMGGYLTNSCWVIREELDYQIYFPDFIPLGIIEKRMKMNSRVHDFLYLFSY